LRRGGPDVDNRRLYSGCLWLVECKGHAAGGSSLNVLVDIFHFNLCPVFQEVNLEAKPNKMRA